MNQRGSLHLLAAGFLFLGIVGSWYLYRSFQSGDLQQDASEMRDDLRKSMVNAAPNMDTDVGRILAGARAKISDTVHKFKGNN